MGLMDGLGEGNGAGGTNLREEEIAGEGPGRDSLTGENGGEDSPPGSLACAWRLGKGKIPFVGQPSTLNGTGKKKHRVVQME